MTAVQKRIILSHLSVAGYWIGQAADLAREHRQADDPTDWGCQFRAAQTALQQQRIHFDCAGVAQPEGVKS